MSLEFFWRIPSHGDGRSVPLAGWDRGDWNSPRPGQIATATRYPDYLVQVANAAELAGFDGALIPTAWNSDEPLVLAALLARETRSLRLMPAFQAAFLSPAYAAKISATLQRISGGRLEWNIITGGNVAGQEAYGDFTPHDARYARTGEFLDVARGLWAGEPFEHHGPLYRMHNGILPPPLNHARAPLIYFSGASDAALDVAARHADIYLMWLEPLDAVRETIAKLSARAARHGRTLRFGIRVDIFARDTEEEAWAEARRLWQQADAGAQRLVKHVTSSKGGESVGAQRQAALRAADATRFEDHIIGSNLWAGLGLVRPGPTVGIFGSHQQVADQLGAYAAAGITTFILAANPHLEEAYRVGQQVLPLVSATQSGGLGRAAE